MKNPNCPACQESRKHKPDEWKQYHPMAGEGYSGTAWSSDAAKAAHEADKVEK